MNNQSNTKYSAFYKSVIHFLIQIGASDGGDFKGVPEEEIVAFEKRTGFPVPPALWEYFRFFGIRLNHFGESDMSYNINKVERYNLLAIEKGSMARFMEGKPEFGRLLFLDYLEDNHVYTLIHEEQIGNPHLCIYEDWGGEFDSYCFEKFHSFTNMMRRSIDLLFTNGRYKYYYSEEEKKEQNKPPITLDSIAWYRVYQEYKIDERRKGQESMDWARDDYYTLHDEIEQKEGRIYSIDEFEWAFLDYFKSRGNWLPDYENPYKTGRVVENYELPLYVEVEKSPYDDFYDSVKSLIYKTSFLSRNDFKKVKSEEIEALGKEIDFAFPRAVKEYFEHFGNGVNHTWINSMLITLSKVREASQHAREHGAKDHLQTERPDLGKLAFLIHDKEKEYYGLIHEGSVENPMFYMYAEGIDFKDFGLKSLCSFTNYVRLELFSYFQGYLLEYPDRKDSISPPNKKITWKPFYEAVVQQGGISLLEEIALVRKNYYLLHDEIERKENRIYDVDEFEWAFIEYYKSLGHWVPEYNNPFKKTT